jgi:hypothetical protein
MTQSDCHSTDAQTTAVVGSSVHQAHFVPLQEYLLRSLRVYQGAANIRERESGIHLDNVFIITVVSDNNGTTLSVYARPN